MSLLVVSNTNIIENNVTFVVPYTNIIRKNIKRKGTRLLTHGTGSVNGRCHAELRLWKYSLSK
jgi:hypothetical protein